VLVNNLKGISERLKLQDMICFPFSFFLLVFFSYVCESLRSRMGLWCIKIGFVLDILHRPKIIDQTDESVSLASIPFVT